MCVQYIERNYTIRGLSFNQSQTVQTSLSATIQKNNNGQGEEDHYGGESFFC